jgi:hypothetical protein
VAGDGGNLMNDTIEADESLQHWPTKGDRPFHPTTEARRPVSIEWARHVGHAAHLYLLGYGRAAELLLPELIRRNDQLVFPFLFLWRQHVELYLKYLIELAREFHGEAGTTAHSHSLPKLWNEFRRLFEVEEQSDDTRSTCDAVEQIIADLEMADPNSTQSRYAEGETEDFLVESLAEVPDGFNPEHFSAVMNCVSCFFDCLQTDYKHRMETISNAC